MKKAMASIAVLSFVALLSTSMVAVFHSTAFKHAASLGNGTFGAPYLIIN